MKNIIVFAVVLAVLIGTVTGCGTERSTGGGKVDEKKTDSSQTVSTDGSTSMEKVIGFLSEAYMEEHGDIKVTYNPTGSSSGIQAVSEGRCDIGLASRDLKEEEQAGLTAIVVAIDGIAIIVNPANPITDLNVEQVGKIYTGEIANWKEVGGEDAPIVCIGREAASGTRDGFEEITGTKDNCKYSQELTSTGDVVQTVSGNPNAVGYASVASVNDSVKVISIEGVVPTTDAIQNGQYKIQRNFVLVTKKDVPLSKAAQDFFDFATSEQADDLITEAGAVPVIR
ncbi:MAG: phosphate ABC transporter substrate-binding protein [Lachnospiraceae bacterium]|nr:phosphate ABC transporter substrate-binding protein [Lachnospiraceae bacterium]MCM1278747.1 phosphate ABC transporter substrate-binding protein [Robinsoniella sp.]